MAKTKSGTTRKKPPGDKARRQLAEYRRKRDFTITPEPGDASADGPVAAAADARGHLRFVIQKHAASSLHFDLRLELGGVMKSWAVPKGPSLDPSDRRLAMQVEDHPIAYNTFEGTIPKDEYGGGTVMLWDRGTYFPDEAKPREDHETALRREMKAGKLSITLEGERLQGSFALVQTDSGAKPKWLLIKHRDRTARPGYDVTADVVTSVESGRTMEEIAGGDSAVWHSNRGSTRTRPHRQARTPQTPQPDVAELAIEPMRPRPRKRLPTRGDWRFEPLPGGRRIIAYVTPDTATLVGENGRATRAWPAISERLQSLAKRAGTSFVLDGEVAEPGDGPRYHVYDLLLQDEDALLGVAWEDRRHALETLFARRRIEGVSVVEIIEDGEAARERAAAEDWPGFRARALEGRYSPGSTSGDWLEFTRDS